MEYQSKQAIDGNDGNDWGGRRRAGGSKVHLDVGIF